MGLLSGYTYLVIINYINSQRYVGRFLDQRRAIYC